MVLNFMLNALWVFLHQSSSELLFSSASERSAIGKRKMAATPLSWFSSVRDGDRENAWSYGRFSYNFSVEKWEEKKQNKTHLRSPETCKLENTLQKRKYTQVSYIQAYTKYSDPISFLVHSTLQKYKSRAGTQTWSHLNNNTVIFPIWAHRGMG